MSWSEDEIRAMGIMVVELINNNDDTETCTGVSINTLLDIAGPSDSASTPVLVGDDGYEVEVNLAEVCGCPDCIMQFRNNGGSPACCTISPTTPESGDLSRCVCSSGISLNPSQAR